MTPHCPQGKAQILTRVKAIHLLSPASLSSLAFCLSKNLSDALRTSITLF